MKRIRIMGLCLVAAFAIGAVASATASAVTTIPPEIGRCVATGAGSNFTSNKCTTEDVGDGTFSWIPGAVAAKFTAVGGTGTLESIPSKGKISCKTVSSSGEYTSNKTEFVTATIFTGCENKAAKVKCESSKANGNSTVGTIINFPLVGEFGMITKPTKAGVDLSGVVAAGPPFSTNLLANFECGAKTQGDGTGAQLFVEGDVIGEIVATNGMSLTSKLKFDKTALGAQKPENFEGGPNTHLITWLFTGGPPAVESSNEVTTTTTTNEEALELRTENTLSP
jgi:hypothetical protein